MLYYNDRLHFINLLSGVAILLVLMIQLSHFYSLFKDITNSE